MRRIILLQVVIFLIFFGLTGTSSSQNHIRDLSGEWQFKMDPENQGIKNSWFTSQFSDVLNLPGCMQEQGYGNIPDSEMRWWRNDQAVDTKNFPWLKDYKNKENFKTQRFLVPDRHYIGAAWYRREFSIPANWEGKTIRLHLERVHWESEIWLDGKRLDKDSSLFTPHIYELGHLSAGAHQLSIRVDNSELVDLGKMAHSVSEQTAGTWNGIVGDIKLEAFGDIIIEQCNIRPHVAEGKLGIIVEISNQSSKNKKINISLSSKSLTKGTTNAIKPLKAKKTIIPGKNEIRFQVALDPEAALWDEFDPHMHELTVAVTGKKIKTTKTIRFGLRDFNIEGRSFKMNGIKTFIRGNTDCAVMPKTGYAPMDVDSWKKVWRAYKDFGLNTARFHSWCPPKAAFIAADEIGIYMAPEVGEWVLVEHDNQKEFLLEESKRILKEYGNHPSFVMMSLGNESGGDVDYFNELIENWKDIDSTRVYSIKANGGNPKNVEFRVVRKAGEIFARYQMGWPPRPDGTEFILQAPQTSLDWRGAVEQFDFPIIQHETAQICATPHPLVELPKFDGYLKATYLDIMVDQLKDRGMLDQIDDFVEASGKWQVEVTREEMEAGFRTPDLAGFHWLSLGDFTGQNTAPVGFCDAFYDPKPYVDAAYVSRWIAPTVLLARLEKRTLTKGDTLDVSIEVTHYGKNQLKFDDLVATLRKENGEIIEQWNLPFNAYEQGSAFHIDNISIKTNKIKAPAKINLLVESKKNKLANDWSLWVYPNKKVEEFPSDIIVAKEWDPKIKAKLEQGATVLLLAQKGSLKEDMPVCFTPNYWTSSTKNKGQSSADGILIDPKHPLFKHFPTDHHVNWQWWDILTQAQPMILDSHDTDTPWPKEYRPLLQAIDNWKLNRKLALLVETKYGKGKLMISSIDLTNDVENRLATNQLRKSMIAYLLSDAFDPETEISERAIDELFKRDKKKQDYSDTDNLPTDG